MTVHNESQTNRHGFPAQTCPKCLGEGVLPKYGHVDGGQCFKCDGQGVVLTAKVQKVFNAWREAVAAAQAGTAADIKVGTQFLVANKWHTALAAPVITGERVNIKTNRGSVGWQGEMTVRIHRPDAIPSAADYIATLTK